MPVARLRPAMRIRARSRLSALAHIGRRVIKRVRGFSVRRIVKGSRPARYFWTSGLIARHPWEFYVRRRIAHLIPRRGGLEIPLSQGFVRIDEADFPQVPEILRLCRHIYSEEKRGQVKSPAPTSTKHKGYLIELLNDDDLVRYPQLVDFCLSPSMVQAVTRYLGTVPVLRRVGLWLSFAAPMDGASRLLHLDPEDLTQVRLFLNVIEITPPQGPLTFLPAETSARVLRDVWRDGRAARSQKPQLRRYTDNEILPRAGAWATVDLSGPAGSGALVDTSRCLHYGSRMQPGSMHLIFQAQFLRYHFQLATATNHFDPARAGGDPTLVRMLAPRPGYACNYQDQ